MKEKYQSWCRICVIHSEDRRLMTGFCMLDKCDKCERYTQLAIVETLTVNQKEKANA